MLTCIPEVKHLVAPSMVSETHNNSHQHTYLLFLERGDMNAYWPLLHKMICDESGAALVEYALILALISLVAVGGFTTTATVTSNSYVANVNGYNAVALSQYADLP